MSSLEDSFLKERIQNYISATSVEYVLLLSGKWGCGKTYLIQEIINANENKTNGVPNKNSTHLLKISKCVLFPICAVLKLARFLFLYIILLAIFLILSFFWDGFLDWFKIIETSLFRENTRIRYLSLNGVSSIDELKVLIYLSATTQKAETRLQLLNTFVLALSHIPCLSLIPRAYIQALSSMYGHGIKTPIILDDTERCKIDGVDFFGFLRAYQDEFKMPIILIGNEEKFEKTFGLSFKDYSEIKEKIIGCTLVKHATTNEAISFFIQNLKLDEKIKPLIIESWTTVFNSMRENEDEEAQTYENLRAFKISMQNIVEYYEHLDIKIKQHTEFTLLFLKVSLALQYAVQLGRFTIRNWDTCNPNEKQMSLNEDCRDTRVQEFLKTYGLYSFALAQQYPIFTLDMWKKLLFGEYVDWKEMNKFILLNREEFKDEHRQSFEKLFSFQTKTKAENEAALMELEADLENNRITNLGDIFAAFSIRTAILKTQAFVLKNDISHQLKELREEFDTYINRLLKRGMLELDESDSRMKHYLDSRSGLRMLLPNLDEVYQSIKMRHLAKNYSKLVEEALQDASNNEMLKLRNVLTVECREAPLFIPNEYITLAKFKELIEKLTPPNIDYLERCLYERYQLGVSKQKDFFITFLPEKDAFIEVETFLSDRIDHLKDEDIYRAYNYMCLRDDIQQILDRMDEYQKELSTKVSQQENETP